MLVLDQDFYILATRWHLAPKQISIVRERVFIEEQGIPPHFEWESSDQNCIHVVAYHHHHDPIGTGRILSSHCIGRIAVLKPWRSQGVGRALLLTLMDIGRALGFSDLYLNAQHTVTGFYSRYGFSACGEPFLEAGILHQRMILNFKELHNHADH